MGVNALEVRRRVMMAQPHRATATGEIASFRTDVLSPLKMEFDLLPVQDLHGYSNPWPGGGNGQLFNKDTATDSYYINADGDLASSSSWSVSDYIPVTPGESITKSGSSVVGTSPCYAFYDSSKQFVSGGRIGALQTLTVPAGASYYRTSVSVQGKDSLMVNKGSSALPWVSYSNICPITGHDGFTRTGTGKNLLDPSLLKDQAAWNLIPIKVKPSTKYTASANKQADNGLLCYFNNTGQLGGGVYYSVYIGHPVTITSTAEGYVYISQRKASGDYSFADFEFQVEEGENAKTFETYTGVSYTTTFPTPPGTVYGGHVTDNGDGTGTLVVDRKIITLGENNVNITGVWGATNSGFACYYGGDNTIKRSSKAISSRFKWSNYGKDSMPLYSFCGGSGVPSTITFILPSECNTKELCQQWFVNNPTQIIAELITPIEYTLSLTALQSLIGQNNIWVDNADSVSVEYWGH